MFDHLLSSVTIIFNLLINSMIYIYKAQLLNFNEYFIKYIFRNKNNLKYITKFNKLKQSRICLYINGIYFIFQEMDLQIYKY